MHEIICKDKNSWDNSFSREFLQSWQWGEFQKSVGLSPLRFQIKVGQNIFWQAQGFEYKIFGVIKFIYFPKISFVELSKEQKVSFFNFLSAQGYMFVRVEPIDNNIEVGGYDRVDVANRQPKNTFVLDITKTEEQLMNSMHAKTRYNIGLAERKGVTVRTQKNIDVFWNLNEETSARDKFKSHNKEYYRKMLELDICHQLTAYVDNIPVASNICINFNKVFTYLHGASSNQFRNLMAPYLLQWESIKFAKGLGAEEYDFGGTAPVYLETHIKDVEVKAPTCYNNFCWDVTHKWTGITRFKVGFYGIPKNYPPAIEVIFKKNIYKLFNKIKSIL
ncbi:MAG: hypothetical protein A2725_02695 [Candidatus Magasanikbacteria bacterium RIFCSPHIGHO2_01_FULL_33_34]|uniref:BioF2-like acetyltransferase domain-containing protein n=1 Tax=Candidatus Magasanikbacteria bacterium RIFCSPHIGHO2_01_FULL_33_34 TaxID=1798671 RepID=A0A1F6LGR5_9BACT|nr:MAG: hypothetical protein A2725_02695 [Candidatus Magasanikbacteria bacterium RIFCSPHIGHO2_01_FULL_33_34]OGH66046.1 MAG: hypothetical protein A3B83_00185 [Candidatus Magasanikbacteria bacterium RIFCSPHIGHO2_02_FULL_33_17]OGH75892.1 MAG: hypothetical protein A3A89_00095 [Candidatus Magasanikbacteria bacterium RIFCSPLOWO2_01_FULL_33_34]OGH81670.1 MAG: hypothetical protein A3F93_01890 [Candidatus Magasanikbacteria bacterium RIFCSPLOWO2_12_FULL_34_7]